MVECCPKITLTVRAEWEAWNYSYSSNSTQPSMITTEYKEPLEHLETDFRFSQAAEAQKKK